MLDFFLPTVFTVCVAPLLIPSFAKDGAAYTCCRETDSSVFSHCSWRTIPFEADALRSKPLGLDLCRLATLAHSGYHSMI